MAAIVPAIAHASNLPHGRWIERCNGLKSDGMDVAGVPPVTDEGSSQLSYYDGRSSAYYDVMNFAPDVKCPAYFNMGLVDYVSPPYGVWAAYMRLGSADKTMIVLPGHGHDWSAEFDRRAWKWLDNVLNKNQNSK